MIRTVAIRRLKRFGDVTFSFPGHVVLAGPNNMGKTTVLQAIAAWNLALNTWKELNNFIRRGGSYERKPLARKDFAAVPLRRFDLLWRDRQTGHPIEIEIRTDEGWSVAMEFIADSTEQSSAQELGGAPSRQGRGALDCVRAAHDRARHG